MGLAVKQSPNDFCLHRSCHILCVVCGRGTCETGSSISLSSLSFECVSGGSPCTLRGVPLSKSSSSCSGMHSCCSSLTVVPAKACQHNQKPAPCSAHRSSSTLVQLRQERSTTGFPLYPPQGWLFCLKLHLEQGTEKVHVSCMMLGCCSWITYPDKSCLIADSITFLSLLLLML